MGSKVKKVNGEAVAGLTYQETLERIKVSFFCFCFLVAFEFTVLTAAFYVCGAGVPRLAMLFGVRIECLASRGQGVRDSWRSGR